MLSRVTDGARVSEFACILKPRGLVLAHRCLEARYFEDRATRGGKEQQNGPLECTRTVMASSSLPDSEKAMGQIAMGNNIGGSVSPSPRNA